MRRENPDSPVLAVGGVILYQDKILLAQRRHEPDLGKWSIPGGAVETGETLLEAVKREMFEECSIDIVAAEPFLVIERIFLSADIVKYHYVIIDFLVSDFKGTCKPSSDVADCKFFSFEEIKTLNVSSSLSNLEKLIGEFIATSKIIHIASRETI